MQEEVCVIGETCVVEADCFRCSGTGYTEGGLTAGHYMRQSKACPACDGKKTILIRAKLVVAGDKLPEILLQKKLARYDLLSNSS